MDLFRSVPKDVLPILFSLLSLEDYFTIRLVCKRFHELLKKDNDNIWKINTLKVWDTYQTDHKGKLVDAQLYSEKSWFWFSKCFANDLVFTNGITTFIGAKKNGYAIVICTYIDIGKLVDGRLYGHGKRVYEDETYTGNFYYGGYHGYGKLVKSDGTIIDGHWKRKPSGYASLTYPDGYKCEGMWLIGVPQFDAEHPDVKRCIEEKVCTGSKSISVGRYPQSTADSWSVYCKTCWIYCNNASPASLKFNIYFKGCWCDKCT
jgi:hypothetical protein